jgi:hypothetical protein
MLHEDPHKTVEEYELIFIEESLRIVKLIVYWTDYLIQWASVRTGNTRLEVEESELKWREAITWRRLESASIAMSLGN